MSILDRCVKYLLRPEKTLKNKPPTICYKKLNLDTLNFKDKSKTGSSSRKRIIIRPTIDLITKIDKKIKVTTPIWIDSKGEFRMRKILIEELNNAKSNFTFTPIFTNNDNNSTNAILNQDPPKYGLFHNKFDDVWSLFRLPEYDDVDMPTNLQKKIRMMLESKFKYKINIYYTLMSHKPNHNKNELYSKIWDMWILKLMVKNPYLDREVLVSIGVAKMIKNTTDFKQFIKCITL